MRRSSSVSLVLTAMGLFGYNAAQAAMPQGAASRDAEWADSLPLTGQALPCKKGKIKLFDCHNVELLSYLPKNSLDQAVGSDLWGWHDSATGREFAIVGGMSDNSKGVVFVEVTDPLTPRYLGMLPARQIVRRTRLSAAVKVYKHYAFIGYEGGNHGLQIFDLTQLYAVKNPPVVFDETGRYDAVTNAHTLTLNQETGFAYVNGSTRCGGGLDIVDVRTPRKPAPAGCYTERNTGGDRPAYVHDAQCVIYRGPDQQYQGREICVNYAATAISIADVTNKQEPKTISLAHYPDAVFTHQGWFTEDQRHIYLNDEGDEVAMGKDRARTRTIGFDLSDLDDPVMSTEFYHTTSSIDHNLYIQSRYMYQGNNDAGLRIVDTRDPKHLKEVGYLTGIGRAWGTYPFFKKDVVGVSTDKGLVLVRLQKR